MMTSTQRQTVSNVSFPSSRHLDGARTHARTPWQGPHSLSRDTAMHRRLTQTESDITNEQQAAARVRAGRNRTVALQQMGKRLQGHMPHATEAKLQQTERLRHPTCGDSICLSTTICAREHIVSVRNRCTDNVHAVERSSGSACPCGVVFRATLRRPATAKSSRRFRR